MGPFMAIITGVLSIPMTFFMSNDAFYFGVLPVLSETAAHYGVSAADMARASITGQPFHLQSPLVPAILLLVSLAKVDLGDHHKKVLWRTAVISLVMLGSRSPHRSHRHRLTNQRAPKNKQRDCRVRRFSGPDSLVSCESAFGKARRHIGDGTDIRKRASKRGPTPSGFPARACEGRGTVGRTSEQREGSSGLAPEGDHAAISRTVSTQPT